MRRRAVVAAALACALATVLVTVAVAAAQAPGQPGRPAPESPAGADYEIGAGDLLAVTVEGVKLFDQQVRVSNSGKIHVPYLGILRVAGMSTTRLEAEFARQLREKGLVKEPWVHVRIEEYRAQPVYILGEVILPGQFVIKRQMYLTDLITLSGGFNEVASPVGYLYRRKPDVSTLPEGEAPTDEAIPIDFQALNEGRDPELNYQLRGGDVLYVPQRRKAFYFVVGDVARPGAFELKQLATDSVLLSQAIALAGGPLRTAKRGKGIVVRFDEKGARQELAADIDAILRGRKPDFPVRANDIVFVPGSGAKTLAYAILGVLPQAVSTNVANVVR